MNIKLRRLAYGGFTLMVMSQSVVGMESINPNTMTPVRSTFQTTEMSPAQDPVKRLDGLEELPKSNMFGNILGSVFNPWYNRWKNNVIGIYTRYESFKKTIKHLEAQVIELTKNNDVYIKKNHELTSDNLVLKSQNESKDQLIEMLRSELRDVKEDKRKLLDGMGNNSRAGSYRGTASNMDVSIEASEISVNRKVKRTV